MTTQIWFLFSQVNDYNQPANVLVAWWQEKPSIETVAAALNCVFPADDDETTLAIVKIWSGEECRINNTDYTLRIVSGGVV